MVTLCVWCWNAGKYLVKLVFNHRFKTGGRWIKAVNFAKVVWQMNTFIRLVIRFRGWQLLAPVRRDDFRGPKLSDRQTTFSERCVVYKPIVPELGKTCQVRTTKPANILSRVAGTSTYSWRYFLAQIDGWYHATNAWQRQLLFIPAFPTHRANEHHAVGFRQRMEIPKFTPAIRSSRSREGTRTPRHSTTI